MAWFLLYLAWLNALIAGDFGAGMFIMFAGFAFHATYERSRL